MRVGFIGTGNMGSAVIKGYSEAAEADGQEILAYNRTRSRAEALAADYPIRVTDSIRELVSESDIVVLGVEPKNFDELMPEIARSFTKDKIFISLAAGITISYLEGHLGTDAKILRAMSNTPIMYGLGVTAIVRNSAVSDDDFEAARSIFAAGGIADEVTEDLISAVTGVSGSNPAYTYMYIGALTEAGIENGMDPSMSRRFAAQAVMGAARMMLESDESPSVLVDRVCTPGGTSIEGVKRLRECGFEEIVKSGARASINRSRQMSEEADAK